MAQVQRRITSPPLPGENGRDPPPALLTAEFLRGFVSRLDNHSGAPGPAMFLIRRDQLRELCLLAIEALEGGAGPFSREEVDDSAADRPPAAGRHE